MSTTYASQGRPAQSPGLRAAAAAVVVATAVVIVAVAGFAFGRHVDAHSTSPAAAHTAVVIQPLPSRSASVVSLQQQLSQLHLYNGTVDGIMGPKTIAAIASVQREAGLPQTGKMNAATQNALDYYLANDLPGSG